MLVFIASIPSELDGCNNSYTQLCTALFYLSCLILGGGAALVCFIHQPGPCNISVSLVLLRLFFLPMFWFVVDSAVVVHFYDQESYRACLRLNRGTDILTNEKIMSLTSARPIAKSYCDCWTVNAEYFVPLNVFYVYNSYLLICLEFDYFMLKLYMLWWWWCSTLRFVHFLCWWRSQCV